MGVVEDYVGSAPLLEHCNHHSHHENLAERLLEECLQSALGLVTGICGCNSCKFAIGIVGTADFGENPACHIGLSHHSKPAGAFGNEERQREECDSGECTCPEHPSPAHLAVPRVDGVVDDRLCDKPVGDLCCQDTKHYSELVERHEAAADIRRGNFGDIHWRQAGGDSDTYSAEEAGYEKQIEVAEDAGSVGRSDEDKCCKREKHLAAEAVGKDSGSHGTNQAAHQSDTHGCTLHRRIVGNAEEHLIERLGTSDYHPVISEEQSTHSRNYADKIHKTFVESVHFIKNF